MTYTIADLARAHGKIRDERSRRTAEYARVDEDLKTEQVMLRQHILKMLTATGGTSIRTPYGTVYRRTVTKSAAADWGAVWDWMKEHDAPDLVQKRLNNQFILDMIEAQRPPGAEDGSYAVTLPPGINLHQEFDISIRKD